VVVEEMHFIIIGKSTRFLVWLGERDSWEIMLMKVIPCHAYDLHISLGKITV